MRGLQVSENPMGMTAIRLHYSAMPERDVQHEDEATRAVAQEWLQLAKRLMPDENRWGQEYEINWWVAQGARVYPEFTESTHAPLPLVPNPRRVLTRAWDFGWHAPACLIASVDSQDRLLVLREIIGREQTTREFAQHVVDQCATWYPQHAPGWQDFCDPAGQQVSATSERNEKRDVEILQSVGIFPRWEFGWTRKDGRALVHQLLVLRTDQTPGVYVDASGCPVLLQGFLGKYVYPESKDGKAKDEPDESNHPWADAHAALRYLVTGLYNSLGLRRFKYQPVVPDRKITYTGYGTVTRKGAVSGPR